LRITDSVVSYAWSTWFCLNKGIIVMKVTAVMVKPMAMAIINSINEKPRVLFDFIRSLFRGEESVC
jgi:hypothetical protein